MATQQVFQTALSRRILRKEQTISGMLLLLLCVFFTVLRWLKTEAFWGDPPRWIFEAWRVSLGELPYRDFTWQYPPLSVLLIGAALRIFGSTFVVLQILVDLISAAVVFQFWRVARLLFPAGMALAVAATLLCAGAGNTGNFALFSLRIYTPALPVGMLGFLLMLKAVIVCIQSGFLDRPGGILLSTGATIALLSKPEFAMGVAGVLLAIAIYEARLYHTGAFSLAVWVRRQASVLALALLPGLALYALLARKVRFDNLMAGLGGYGMAYLVCPWWPTGLALFGALVALCQGAAVLLSLHWLWHWFRRGNLHPISRKASILLSAAAVLAVPATILYFPYCISEFPVFAHGSTPARTIAFFLLVGSVLLPVMWWAIALWPGLAFGFGKWKEISPQTGILVMLCTAGILMSTRSLFGGTLNQLTLVTVAAYPVWFLLGPMLLERFLTGSEARAPRSTSSPLLMLVAGYALLRFGAAAVTELQSRYIDIRTSAGLVRVSDRHAISSAGVYRYVIEHTSPSDNVLDIAYGGEVNFASRRPSFLYSTQFSAIAPSQKYMDVDLERIRARPPKLVIAEEQPGFGAEYGLCTETGCMFPELVWRPTRLACDQSRKFPVLDFIQENYSPVAQFAEITVYAPRVVFVQYDSGIRGVAPKRIEKRQKPSPGLKNSAAL